MNLDVAKDAVLDDGIPDRGATQGAVFDNVHVCS
jgi:hypothetical protein